jgi:WXXGXW repeat (2 copies)
MKRSVRWLVFGTLMLTVSVLSLSTVSSAQIGVGVSVRIGPPALPVYAQPICPGPGYLWTPGYWAWSDDDGYYWVPGTWVIAPVGMLWTPGYWGWGGGFYLWHTGYWGPHIGFYGGINYGFGYGGFGYGGGEWRGDRFFYNRSVTNVNVTNVTNVYNRTVMVNNRRNVSFNGGSGGITARPTRQEEAFAREPHRAALAEQSQHERAASQNRQLFASENHGRPAIAATGRAGEFNGRNVQRARAAGEPYRAPKISPREARASSANNGGGTHGVTDAHRNEPAGNSGKVNNVPRPGNQGVKNNGGGSAGQMSSRNNLNTKRNTAAQTQDRAVQQQRQAQQAPQQRATQQQQRQRAAQPQQRAAQPQRAQPKSEAKHNDHPHR